MANESPTAAVDPRSCRSASSDAQGPAVDRPRLGIRTPAKPGPQNQQQTRSRQSRPQTSIVSIASRYLLSPVRLLPRRSPDDPVVTGKSKNQRCGIDDNHLRSSIVTLPLAFFHLGFEGRHGNRVRCQMLSGSGNVSGSGDPLTTTRDPLTRCGAVSRPPHRQAHSDSRCGAVSRPPHRHGDVSSRCGAVSRPPHRHGDDVGATATSRCGEVSRPPHRHGAMSGTATGCVARRSRDRATSAGQETR